MLLICLIEVETEKAEETRLLQVFQFFWSVAEFVHVDCGYHAVS